MYYFNFGIKYKTPGITINYQSKYYQKIPNMNPILRNILAVIAGIIVGGLVNMGIITISGSIIPPPEGADMTTTEGLKAAMHLMQPKHFIMPFLAHALGTFAGAFLAGILAANRKMLFSIVIGI